MIDAKKLQDKLIKHLNGMDLTAMSLQELNSYADVVGKLTQMAKPDWTEMFASTMAGLGCAGGFNAPGAKVVD